MHVYCYLKTSKYIRIYLYDSSDISRHHLKKKTVPSMFKKHKYWSKRTALSPL